MSHRIRNESALTIYSLGIGVASGLATIILSNRMRKKASTHTGSVVGITLLVAGMTIGATYLIRLSEENPHIEEPLP